MRHYQNYAKRRNYFKFRCTLVEFTWPDGVSEDELIASTEEWTTGLFTILDYNYRKNQKAYFANPEDAFRFKMECSQ